MDISGARYFKSRKDGGTDFTTRLVSNVGIYSWYEGSKEENTQLLQKVGLVPHEHCAPYLAHVQGNKNCKVDVKLCRADILDVKLPAKERSAPEKERNEHWKDIASKAAKEIRESRKPFEDLAELPLGSTHTVTAIGCIDHYGQQKLVVKLDDGITYQVEMFIRRKEQLTKMYKIVISKTKLLPTRKKFAVFKVVQKGDWTGLLDYEKVPLLPANKKRNAVKVLDVKSVEHKGQKRKLLLTEDGTVYKVKRSKLENNVEAGQYVQINTAYLYYIVIVYKK